LKGRLLVVLLAASLSGCQTLRKLSEERYSRNIALGHAWISDQAFPAGINVAGSWRSSEWGDVFLSQTDRVLKGHFGKYHVDGVVSGQKAYLLASQGGWYQYSIILEMPAPNILLGYYSRAIPYQSSNRRNIRLDRAGAVNVR
jgi:hypothetical protein